jgi:hypothetical protein
MAKAMDGTWEPGAGAKEPSGVGAWNGRRGVVGTGEALGGPEPAGFEKQCLPRTGETGNWQAATRESEGVVVPPDGPGQHNPAEREGPLLHRRACWGERIGECPHAG